MKSFIRFLAALGAACVLALAALTVGCQLTPGGGTDVGNPEMVRVTGSIRHMDGSPAQDLPLHLRPESHLGAPDSTHPAPAANGSLQEGHTDSQGFFTFDSVPKGEYRIEAMDTNGRGAVIPLKADGTVPSIVLNPAFLDSTGSLAGRINYLGTDKLTKIAVEVYGTDRTTFATIDGNFTLSDLPPGKYRLHIATASGSSSVDVPETEVKAGGSAQIGTVDLGP
jgi:hypothetical protein